MGRHRTASVQLGPRSPPDAVWGSVQLGPRSPQDAVWGSIWRLMLRLAARPREPAAAPVWSIRWCNTAVRTVRMF